MATESTPFMAGDFVYGAAAQSATYDVESSSSKSLDVKVEQVPPLSEDHVQRTGILSWFTRGSNQADPDRIATQPSV